MPPAFKNWITHVQTPCTERLLKYAANSDVISFAGGLPAEDLFPAADVESAFQYVIREQAAEALQYTWTEGYEPLRARIVERLHEHGLSAKPAQILVTHGAQQALDLLAKLYIRPGDWMVVESPQSSRRSRPSNCSIRASPALPAPLQESIWRNSPGCCARIRRG